MLELDFLIQNIKRKKSNDDNHPKAYWQIILRRKIAINYPDQSGGQDREAKEEAEITVKNEPLSFPEYSPVSGGQAQPSENCSLKFKYF
jgi:hypothetical protein